MWQPNADLDPSNLAHTMIHHKYPNAAWQTKNVLALEVLSAHLYTNHKLLCHRQPPCFTAALNGFHNKTQKHSRDPHIICQAAVSKPLHLAKTCSKKPGQAGLVGEPKGGGLAQPGQNVLFTGPDTQSRNAFKQSKGTERKKGERREGGRRGEKGGMSAEGICASLWETLLVLIYTSMTTAQNELTVRREQQRPKRRNKKKGSYGESE